MAESGRKRLTLDGFDKFISGVIAAASAAWLGVCITGVVWDRWAIKEHYAYRDPVTGVTVYDREQVEQFWREHRGE